MKRTNLIEQLLYQYRKNKVAVVSNGKGCAQVGCRILREGGSAVDAAIATLLCESVILPQSMGIGGGFVAIIYTKSTGKIETVTARIRSSAVPGELLGYWEMHQKYGVLPWKRLFEPTIQLCKEGHWVSDFLERAIRVNETNIRKEPTMAEVFVKEDGTLYQQGDFLKRPNLARTLEIIAEKGVGEMYDGGEIAQKLVEDIKEVGGNITVEDLKNFKVLWNDSNHAIGNITEDYTLYTTPLPSCGPLLAFIMNVMSGLYTSNNEIYWQRLIETFKHAYGHRSNLGDMENDPEMRETIEATLNQLKSPDFIERTRSLIHDDRTYQDIKYYGANFSIVEDHGTANVAVLADNGDAITVTSTLNTYFGGKVRSRRTGIILNDEMKDFSIPGTTNIFGIPPSPSNYIKPGKRPMSSMCPAIILDNNGDVQMLVGAAGGSKITSSVATVILKYLVLNQTLEDCIYEDRLHHQLMPMCVDVCSGIPESVREYLESCGHVLNILPEGMGYAVVTAIGTRGDSPMPMYDRRRVGSTCMLQKK